MTELETTSRDAAVYLPSQEEIAEACRAIQAGWSVEEEEKRRAWSPAEWTVPQVGSSLG